MIPEYSMYKGLAVKRLSIHYGSVLALDKISFVCHAGQSMAILGKNGAGKSTLLKSIAGLIPEARGHLIWSGEAIEEQHQNIAYLPQRESVDWNFPITVRKLVEMGRYPHLGLFKRYGKDDEEAVNQALRAMQLDDLENRQISQLSGGQQQRTFIARALAQTPTLLLLDEPFAGLDEPSQNILSDLMKKLVANGSTIIASHHDWDSTATLFDQALLLSQEVLACGPSAEVLNTENKARVFAS